jgi:hypothetical protein
MTPATLTKPRKNLLVIPGLWPMKRVRYGLDWHHVPIIDRPYQRILKLVTSPGYELDMCTWWHQSDLAGVTYLCFGSAIIEIGGKPAASLHRACPGMYTAARLILEYSSPLAVPSFDVGDYDWKSPDVANRKAMRLLRRYVKLERASCLT